MKVLIRKRVFEKENNPTEKKTRGRDNIKRLVLSFFRILYETINIIRQKSGLNCSL